MDRFDRPGGNLYEVRGVINQYKGLDERGTLATIQADYVTFEPGWFAFWTGSPGEEKTLVTTFKNAENVKSLVQVPLTGEYLEKYQQWQTEAFNLKARPDWVIDRRPHSRACGIYSHPHGAFCALDCPTCHGALIEETTSTDET